MGPYNKLYYILIFSNLLMGLYDKVHEIFDACFQVILSLFKWFMAKLFLVK